MVLEVLTVPHPVLAKKARAVRDDEFGPELERRLSDMAETMYAAPGVGLAGPQVGDSRRIIVLDPGEGEARGVRLHKMVNPTIMRRDGKITWGETCLSVPEFEVEVQRARVVEVSWRDPAGQPHTETFEDYEAVVVQHELDHLEGRVILDRVSGFQRSRYLRRRRRGPVVEAEQDA
jgi:peptide deformylase